MHLLAPPKKKHKNSKPKSDDLYVQNLSLNKDFPEKSDNPSHTEEMPSQDPIEEKIPKKSLSSKFDNINILQMDRSLTTKQFITANFMILLLGLLFCAGIYVFLHVDIFQKTASSQYLPVSKEPSSFSLDVHSPENDILSFEKDIVVSGKTAPRAVVIITLNNQTVGFEASDKGDFTRVIPLEKGPNILAINSFDSQGNSKQITKHLYFTEEKLEDDK
jgi:hypothetical protein